MKLVNRQFKWLETRTPGAAQVDRICGVVKKGPSLSGATEWQIRIEGQEEEYPYSLYHDTVIYSERFWDVLVDDDSIICTWRDTQARDEAMIL